MKVAKAMLIFLWLLAWRLLRKTPFQLFSYLEQRSQFNFMNLGDNVIVSLSEGITCAFLIDCYDRCVKMGVVLGRSPGERAPIGMWLRVIPEELLRAHIVYLWCGTRSNLVIQPDSMRVSERLCTRYTTTGQRRLVPNSSHSILRSREARIGPICCDVWFSANENGEHTWRYSMERWEA